MTPAERAEAYIRAQLDAMVAAATEPKEVEPEPKHERYLRVPPPVMPPVIKTIHDPERVLAAVAIVYDAQIAAIKGRSRSKSIIWARHHLSWALRNKSDMSLIAITKFTNRKCHSSVINSIETFEKYKDQFTDQIYRVELELAPPPVVTGA